VVGCIVPHVAVLRGGVAQLGKEQCSCHYHSAGQHKHVPQLHLSMYMLIHRQMHNSHSYYVSHFLVSGLVGGQL
jgi:hypothetical protein